MSRLLYTLEDLFDALADEWHGSFAGWLSRLLRGLCALVGDSIRPRGLIGRPF